MGTSGPHQAAAPGPGPAPCAGGGIAFLLVQLGLHLARRFGELLEPLGLEQRQAGMLLLLAGNDGRSQQAIAELIGVNPTRMVFLTDELERLGLVERRRNPADRRSHALHLTEAGIAMLARIRAVTAGHEAAVTAGLTTAERAELAVLLRRLAAGQGLAAGALPGAPPAHATPKAHGTPKAHAAARPRATPPASNGPD